MDSTYGEGSTFSFTLQVSPAPTLTPTLTLRVTLSRTLSLTLRLTPSAWRCDP